MSDKPSQGTSLKYQQQGTRSNMKIPFLDLGVLEEGKCFSLQNNKEATNLIAETWGDDRNVLHESNSHDDQVDGNKT